MLAGPKTNAQKSFRKALKTLLKRGGGPKLSNKTRKRTASFYKKFEHKRLIGLSTMVKYYSKEVLKN